MSKILKSDLFDKIPNVDAEKFHAALSDALKNFTRKIIVLDDDPTGVQTVNGISVYTDWTAKSIAAGFAEENAMFFILTNSRAFSESKTRAEHKKIAENICAASKNFGRDFLIISRSDSTLRGHYPLETQILRETLAASVKISDALTKIVNRIKSRPKFLIAKGGITSADIGEKGLGVKKALVLGQIAAGIPVWQIGAESKFPSMSYIIFPGNVGNVDTLKKIVALLDA